MTTADGRRLAYSKLAAARVALAVGGFIAITALWMLVSTPLKGTEAASPCQFQKASQPLKIALCETFDAPSPDASSRSGDLNSKLWGVSRIGNALNVTQGEFNDFAPAHLVGCGATQVVTAPRDVRICSGRLLEALNDNGGEASLGIYPKQPFDISDGRTGTVVFDVSADSEGPHAAWPEFWWTDQPVPAPHGPVATQETYARNAFGFSLAGCWAGGRTGVDTVSIVKNYQHSYINTSGGDCITRGSATGALNHFEVRISPSRFEVWGSDAGATTLKLLASGDVAMPLTKGLIWGLDVHYNACKFFDNTQCDHTFAWDNIGFDGPTPYRDLAFDVQDSHSPKPNSLGWGVPLSVQTQNVYWEQTPTSAIATFNWFAWQPAVPDVRVNGGPWHSTPWMGGNSFNWHTIAVPIPLAEVRTGANTIEMRSSDGNTLVSNINLIMIAGAPVPGASSATATPTPTGSATATPTGSATATATATSTSTATATPTKTATASATPSATKTPAPTVTASPTPTATPSCPKDTATRKPWWWRGDRDCHHHHW